MLHRTQYCLYLVLSSADEQYLLKNILKTNQDYPKMWKHYHTKGFHFQLTKWSTQNFNMLNILRTGICLHGQPDAIIVTQNISGWASVSFQSFKLQDLNEKLQQEFGLSVVSNLKGIIGYSEEFPSDNTLDDASKFIMNTNWYIVKMQRTGEIYNQISNRFLWRVFQENP